jgi:nucleoside-diphosphate kinase
MAGNLTFAMIKPDAVESGNTGKILAHAEAAGFGIQAMAQLRLSRVEAEAFYAVHSERPFYGELVEFMSSGPVVAMVLKAESAVSSWREAIGATDPTKADAGTIRQLYAESIGRNAVHGSDSDENAAREIAFFFPEGELALLGTLLPG